MIGPRTGRAAKLFCRNRYSSSDSSSRIRWVNSRVSTITTERWYAKGVPTSMAYGPLPKPSVPSVATMERKSGPPGELEQDFGIQIDADRAVIGTGHVRLDERRAHVTAWPRPTRGRSRCASRCSSPARRSAGSTRCSGRGRARSGGRCRSSRHRSSASARRVPPVGSRCSSRCRAGAPGRSARAPC